MSFYFLLNTIHFAVELTGAVVLLMAAWLTLDAYVLRKEFATLARAIGLGLFAIWQAISALRDGSDLLLYFGFLLFLIGLVLALIVIALPLKTELLILGMMLVLVSLIVLFYYHVFSERYFFTRIFRLLGLHKVKKLRLFECRIKEMEKVMINYHLQNRRNFYTVIVISFFGWIFTLLQLHFGLAIIGITTATVSQLFIILVFVGLAFLIPIPLAVGSLEALQISSFALLRLGPSASAVAMSFLIRALDLFWIILALVFLGSFRLNIVKVFTRSLKTVDEELTEVKLKRSGASVRIIRRRQKAAEPRKPARIERWITAHKKKRQETQEREKQEQASQEREEHMFSHLTKR